MLVTSDQSLFLALWISWGHRNSLCVLRWHHKQFLVFVLICSCVVVVFRQTRSHWLWGSKLSWFQTGTRTHWIHTHINLELSKKFSHFLIYWRKYLYFICFWCIYVCTAVISPKMGLFHFWFCHSGLKFSNEKFFGQFSVSYFFKFYQISSKINIFITIVSFRHFVSFLSKTKSLGAYWRCICTELFGALPSSLQCSILLRVADTSTDVLNQCRLFLLVVNRYPNQLSDQGVGRLFVFLSELIM